MDWNYIQAEVIRRSWTLTTKPAYFGDGVSGTVVELYDFDPHDEEEVLREIVRIDSGNHADPEKVLAAALRLCRELDPAFG